MRTLTYLVASSLDGRIAAPDGSFNMFPFDPVDQIQCEMDSDLLMELTSRLWKMDSRGRRGVESKDDYKKRGYRSPDKADAFIMCFYMPVPMQTVSDVWVI